MRRRRIFLSRFTMTMVLGANVAFHEANKDADTPII